MHRPLPFLLTLALLAACGSERSSAPAPDPDLLVANDLGLSLGGEKLADAPADAWTKLEPLSARLTARREKWTAEHPDGGAPPAALTLELGPALTCRAAMSVFMTAARSGFVDLTVKQGTLSVSLPHTPSQEDVDPDRCLVPIPSLAARFFASGDVEVALQPCAGAFDVAPAASLPSMVNELCNKPDGCFDVLRISCDEGVPMARVLAALAEVRKSHPKVGLGIGYPCRGDGPSPFYPRLAPPEPLVSNTVSTPPPAPSAPSKKALPLKVRVDTITTTGPLTPQEVEEALRPKIPEIQGCYAEALAEAPDLAGRAVVKLVVGKKGAVMQVLHGDSRFNRGTMADSCIVRAFYHGISFPARGALSTVTYPVLLSPR